MTAVGWKARLRKCERGNHYQYWVNTSIPTTPNMLVCPVLDCGDTVTFLPPASMIPCAKIAPNLAITSSCLSLMTLVYSALNNNTDEPGSSTR